MVKKVVLLPEGHAEESRKAYRKNLGKLKDLTVEPKTKERYQGSLKKFFAFLKANNMEMPKKREAMDDLVADYLEFLWSEGEGRATASTFMAGLQDYDPKLKNCLPGS